MTKQATIGTVYLVGAGPGDPGLITLRAVECLRMADVVLHDYLANPGALQHTTSSAELICLGDHISGRIMEPEEVIAKAIDAARKGKCVVRLKGGDPSIFGRGADEVEALREAGVPYEIVPGITAALAAAAYCEIPITHHDDASAVVLVTGTERRGKPDSNLDYDALARFHGTIVFYMGVTKAALWSQKLMDGGMDPEVPIAIVRWCTWTRQQSIRTNLRNVAQVVKEQRIRPPALFIIGNAVVREPAQTWFDARNSPSTDEQTGD